MADNSIPPARPATALSLLARVCLLVLALGGGPAAPLASAEAAASAQEETIANIHFHLGVRQPPQYCAGQTYSIEVTPLADVSGRTSDGRRFNQPDRPVTGVAIKAEITDPSVATIQPATQRSGRVDLHRNMSYDDHPHFGEVTFQLRAVKAGATNLFLTGQVPAQFSGGRTQYFGHDGFPAGFPIRVINCEYKVSVIYDWAMSGTGFRYWSVGTMNARVTASDPEYYGGDGTLAFFLNHYDFTCNERLTYDNPTHITLRHNFQTDQLELTFSMTAGSATPRCPNIYLVSNSPFTDPASPWAGRPLTFPLEGDTKEIVLIANTPDPKPRGHAIITVQPVTSGSR